MEVVQVCQVHSHNMVPYVCLPGQVELKEQYKYASARMCITVVLLSNHYCRSRSKTSAGVNISYVTAVTTSVIYLYKPLASDKYTITILSHG